MNKKGQTQIEAIICFAVFLGTTAALLAAINSAGNQASQAMQSLKAKAQAETCCIAADALYTANAQQANPGSAECTAEANKVESKADEKTKQSTCLAKEIRLIQKGPEKILEVKASGHYR